MISYDIGTEITFSVAKYIRKGFSPVKIRNVVKKIGDPTIDDALLTVSSLWEDKLSVSMGKASPEQVGRLMGQIEHHLNTIDLPKKKGRKKKVSERDQGDIKWIYHNTPRKISQIARQFKLSPGTVDRIIMGKY